MEKILIWVIKIKKKLFKSKLLYFLKGFLIRVPLEKKLIPANELYDILKANYEIKENEYFSSQKRI